MAEEDGGPPSGPTSKKADANRQKVLVGVGIVGLILTVMLLRKSKAQAADSGTANTWSPAQGYAQDASGSAGYGVPTDSYGNSMDTIDAAVQQLQTEYGQLQSNSGTITAPASSAGSVAATTTQGGAAAAVPMYPGQTELSNWSSVESYFGAGDTISYKPGGTPAGAPLVTYAKGGKVVSALPAASSKPEWFVGNP